MNKTRNLNKMSQKMHGITFLKIKIAIIYHNETHNASTVLSSVRMNFHTNFSLQKVIRMKHILLCLLGYFPW